MNAENLNSNEPGNTAHEKTTIKPHVQTGHEVRMEENTAYNMVNPKKVLATDETPISDGVYEVVN